MTDLEDRLRRSLREYGDSLDPSPPRDQQERGPVPRRWVAAAAIVVLFAGTVGLWQLRATDRSIAPAGTDVAPSGIWTVPSPAPLAARQFPHVMWTGSRFIVWGGVVGNVGLADGALYDPASDSWSSIPLEPRVRPGAPAVWAGDRMVVLSDLGGDALDPVTGTWAALPDLEGVAAGAGFTDVVWAGDTLLGIGVHGSDAAATLTAWELAGDDWVEQGSLRTTGSAPAVRYLTVVDQTLTHAPIATDDGFVLWDDNSTGWRFTIGGGWTQLPALEAYDGDVLVTDARVVWFQGALVAIATGKVAASDDTRVATLGDDGWSAWTVVGGGAMTFLVTPVAAADRVVLLGTFDGIPRLIDPRVGTMESMTGYPIDTTIVHGVGWSGSALLVWGGQTPSDSVEASTDDPPQNISDEGALWTP